MQSMNLSDTESSTGSSGHDNYPMRYMCYGCSQVFASEQTLREHQTASESSRMTRNVLNLLRSLQPGQINVQRAHPLAPPNAGPSNPYGLRLAQPQFHGFGINPVRVHRHHPYQRQARPVPEQDDWGRTRDFLGQMERANATGRGGFLELTLTHPIVKGRRQNGEGARSIKQEELDLKLKL